MIEITHIADIPVRPAWLDFKMQPFARLSYVETRIHPWALYYKSDREQSIIDYQLMSFRNAVQRMLTVPFDKIDELPLLTNGRLQLCTGPHIEPRKTRTPRKKAVAK